MSNNTMVTNDVPPNITARLFESINKIGFLTGLPNIWVHDVDCPDLVKKFYRIYRPVTLCFMLPFICFEWAALYTQENLTEKQSVDLVMFSTSHPILMLWILVTERRQEQIKVILHQLAVVLKEFYNDEEVELEMVRKAKRSSLCYSALFMMALVFYGFDGIMQVIRGEGTFTTVIMFWPDVTDASAPANAARILYYLLWWVYMSRVCSVYITVIPVLVCLSHQFKNLQSYFYSLNGIWDESCEQDEKERKYEKAFKIGVRVHSQTLWCTAECQSAYDALFSGQVLMTVAVLVLLMTQMMNSERTLENILSIATTGSAMLISTGFFMWNAGDVTIEAAEMSTAVYNSGWHNCQLSSRRVRGLMIITMTQSQRPVKLWALGIVELSYRSYVSIVKSSYSVFSVLF